MCHRDSVYFEDTPSEDYIVYSQTPYTDPRYTANPAYRQEKAFVPIGCILLYGSLPRYTAPAIRHPPTHRLVHFYSKA